MPLILHESGTAKSLHPAHCLRVRQKPSLPPTSVQAVPHGDRNHLTPPTFQPIPACVRTSIRPPPLPRLSLPFSLSSAQAVLDENDS